MDFFNSYRLFSYFPKSQHLLCLTEMEMNRGWDSRKRVLAEDRWKWSLFNWLIEKDSSSEKGETRVKERDSEKSGGSQEWRRGKKRKGKKNAASEGMMQGDEKNPLECNLRTICMHIESLSHFSSFSPLPLLPVLKFSTFNIIVLLISFSLLTRDGTVPSEQATISLKPRELSGIYHIQTPFRYICYLAIVHRVNWYSEERSFFIPNLLCQGWSGDDG